MTDSEKQTFPRIRFLEKWKDKISEKIDGVKTGKPGVQSDEMASLPSKLRALRQRVPLRIVLPAIAAIVLIGGVIVYSQIRVLRSYRILSSVERSDDSATGYVRLADRTLKCNPNGVTCVNDSNEVQWNVTFTMQNPVVDTCGSVVAVGDQRGQDVYVFDKDGQIGHFQTEYRLLRLSVASQGVVAAVLEDGELTWVNVYDSQGTIIVRIRTSMNELGYPLSTDLSPNGQKLAIAYLTMDNNDIKSQVAFYNFSSVGQNKTDHLVSEEEFPGTVVSEITFLNENYAAAFRDDGITFFSGRQIPEKKNEITVEQEIISVFHNEKYAGYVSASDEEEQKHKYKLQIYRANGSKCGTQYFDEDYTDIAAGDGEIILHGDSRIEIYAPDGSRNASVSYEKSIIDVIKIGGFHLYEIITRDSTDKIRLK